MILLLHLAVAVSLWWLPVPFRWLLLPMVLVSALLAIAKHGQLWLAHSVARVDQMPEGWFLTLKNRSRIGPLQLAPATRQESAFIRLSLIPVGEGEHPFLRHVKVRHILLTPGRIGHADYHRLQLYLRWAVAETST